MRDPYRTDAHLKRGRGKWGASGQARAQNRAAMRATRKRARQQLKEVNE